MYMQLWDPSPLPHQITNKLYGPMIGRNGSSKGRWKILLEEVPFLHILTYFVTRNEMNDTRRDLGWEYLGRGVGD